MNNKPSNLNARKALEEMKLEIANELNVDISAAGLVGGTMTRRLVEMGQKQLIENKDKNTFNPS